MKNLILSLVVLFGLFSISYGQVDENVVASKGKAALIESRTSGEYEFQFDNGLTKESVEKAASFYVQFFTVDYNEEAEIVKIKMLDNSPSSRVIISRFLSYTKMRYIKVDDKKLNMSDFIEAYLK